MKNSRLFEILYLLMEKRSITAGELAERLEVSERTIYRDIDALSAAGIPVFTQKGQGGGIRLMEQFILDKALLSQAQQDEILFALQAILATGGAAEGETLARLTALFRRESASWLEVDFTDWGSGYDQEGNYVLGPNDLDLAVRLRKAGSDHRKFIRQIFVSVDITAPLYWWKEYDTYKVATVANSTSTMHRIHRKPFEQADFSCDRMTPDTARFMETVVEQLEKIRKRYLETKSKEDWYDMIQLLPSSYNQMRTCSLNYETLVNIYYARRNHKLDEWHVFCKWIRNLPYGRELIAAEDDV